MTDVSDPMPSPDSALPTALQWAHALGVSPDHPPSDLIGLAHGLLAHDRWIPIGDDWPAPGQAIMVAILDTATGQRSTMSAGFRHPETDPLDLMWPYESADGDDAYNLPPEDLRRYNLDRLQDRTKGFQFSMGGGDWSATFDGPLFARRGMDYVESASTPWCFITHWRARPVLPAYLQVPAFIQNLAQTP